MLVRTGDGVGGGGRGYRVGAVARPLPQPARQEGGIESCGVHAGEEVGSLILQQVRQDFFGEAVGFCVAAESFPDFFEAAGLP